MNSAITIKTAVRSIKANLGRSLLTILGIVIGIVAVVLVVALGQGARNLIVGEIESVGANAIIIRPGRQPEGPTDVAQSILGDALKSRDVEALRRSSNVPGIIDVQPAVIVSGAVTYRDNIYRPITLGWTTDGLFDIYDIMPSEGSSFSEDDIRHKSKVALLGSKVRENLFGESDALGEFIRLRGHNLRVIGVLPPTGQVSSFNFDDIIVIPYTTGQVILGNDYFQEIIVRVDPKADPEIVAADIRATLRETHGIDNTAKDDFFVWTQQDIVDRLKTVTQVLTIFLVAISSISLVVGGVGIMNIMLVTVTERTHEIGLRKAIGATNRDIMQQFLFEAVTLTFIGGLIGTIIALTVTYLITAFIRLQYGIDWPLTLPVGAIALGISMAVLIGLVFGIYPARRAARLNPIEALRYE